MCNSARILMILFGILISASGCGEVKHSEVAAEERAQARGGQLLTKAVLEERSFYMDKVLEQEYGEVASKVAEEERVKPSDLQMGKGVTFTSIPMSRLLDERSSDDILGKGIEALFQPDDISRVLPVLLTEKRVVASLTCSWDPESRKPRIQHWEPGSSLVFAKQIENARRRHSGGTAAYKGVSIYGLNKHFLYFDKDGSQFMVPLERDVDHGFIPGEERPVREAIDRLKNMALEKKNDGPG